MSSGHNDFDESVIRNCSLATATGIDLTTKDTGEIDSSKAAHNPAQYLHVSARTDSQTPPTADKKIPLLPVPALPCETVPTAGMPPQGLEPVPSSLQKTPFLKQGNAQYNALFGDDERLRLLLEAWAELPESVKTAVMEMVGG